MVPASNGGSQTTSSSRSTRPSASRNLRVPAGASAAPVHRGVAS